MVGFEILIQIDPLKQPEFFQAYEMIKASKIQDNSRICLNLFKQVDSPNVFLWVEHWRNKEVLKDYYTGENYRTMLGAIGILGKLINQKEIVYEDEI